MTAYDLFKRAYMHHMGQAVRRIWTTNKDDASPKLFIEQTFEEALSEYGVVYAYNDGFNLAYMDNSTNDNIASLKQIDAQSGYWLFFYDGDTYDWLAMQFKSKSEAKDTYKKLYSRYFRHQDWFWIIVVT